jgi:probable HAF family extracellular repeat protein
MTRQIHTLPSYQGRRQPLRRMGVLHLVVSMLFIAASAQAQSIVPQNNYTLVDLGVNDSAIGHGINNAGQVVGYMGARPFRTMANQPIVPASDDLGVLPGHTRSFAHAIDSSGVVVGSSVDDNPYEWRAFRYGFNGAGMESLDSVGKHSFAYGINDHGWIVGAIVTSSSQLSQGMISWGPGWTYSMESWLGYPRQSEAYDVNNSDQIVGWLSTTTTMPQAFLYDARAGINRLTRIGNLPQGRSSRAYGVNDSGQVVGEADDAGWYHAFSWKDADNNGVSDPGEMRRLETGYPCSRAAGVNNGGTVVGYICSNSPMTYGQHQAAMFSLNGQVTDLNTLAPGSGWTLREAAGINDNGQIVGSMQDANGRVHAFRLDPPPPPRIILWP